MPIPRAIAARQTLLALVATYLAARHHDVKQYPSLPRQQGLVIFSHASAFTGGQSLTLFVADRSDDVLMPGVNLLFQGEEISGQTFPEMVATLPVAIHVVVPFNLVPIREAARMVALEIRERVFAGPRSSALSPGAVRLHDFSTTPPTELDRFVTWTPAMFPSWKPGVTDGRAAAHFILTFFARFNLG